MPRAERDADPETSSGTRRELSGPFVQADWKVLRGADMVR